MHRRYTTISCLGKIKCRSSIVSRQETTDIHYFVPETVKKAQLQITTIGGKVLKTFPLQTGKSLITLVANQLAAGNYIYTLFADGQIVESKRMVLTK